MNDLSIIIPVRKGEKTYIHLLESLLKNSPQFEIILVGPDFLDKKSADSRVQYLFSPTGRARQQNIAALKASKTFLWFLHADSRTPDGFLSVIENSLLKRPDALFYFDLDFLNDGPKFMLLNTLGAYWRSHFLNMPFGDQGFFLSKKNFLKLGQFSEAAVYGEDHLLVWKAKLIGVDVLPCHEKLFTSARKYKTYGWIKTTLKHIYLTYLQATPELLKLLFKNKKKSTTAVAIFVKTPGVSVVKSRLAKDLNTSLAEDFFRLSLKATEAIVVEAMKQSGGDIQGYWAVAEKNSLHHNLWKNLETVSQGEGGLGERLSEVYNYLIQTHERVLLIGADLPHMTFQKLLDAHQKLKTTDQFVMGITDDGGFYLFGGMKKIEKEKWTAIAYSSETTAIELITSLGKENFLFIDQDFDIDYLEDLKKLSNIEDKKLLPEQNDIIDWVKKLALPD